MSRIRGIRAAREATVQICDSDGHHCGQGLLVVLSGEGSIVLTCHHVVAPLRREGIYIRITEQDQQLSKPVRVDYDEDRSRPEVDAVVLRLAEEFEYRQPQLGELDLDYDGGLECTVITHVEPNSFDANLSISSAINIPAPVTNGELGRISSYIIPTAFRLAQPTDVRKGISGGVVVCDGVVLGLAQSARAWEPTRQAEAYMLPLSLWAEGWPSLKDEIRPFDTGDQFDRSLQGYLKALRIFSSNLPYLALDEILTGSRRSLRELYIPLRVRAEVSEDKDVDETVEAVSDNGSTQESDMRVAPPKVTVVGLNEVLHRVTNHSARSCALFRGHVGAGKSTLLYHIAEHAYQSPYRVGLSKPHLPLIVRLEDVANVEGASHEERLVNAISRAGALPLISNPPAGFFEQWTLRENTPWLLLLDGLDEVPAEKRAGVLRWIHDLLASFGERRLTVVVTSRPRDKELPDELLPHFAKYNILAFDSDQQHDFAARWFPTTASDFLEKFNRVLAGSPHREPPETTPLLLTIAAAVYRRDGDLPEASWIELYGEFIEILFAEAMRRGLAAELGQEVSDVVRSGVELIAQRMTETPTQNTLEDLTKVIAKHLRDEFTWGAVKAEIRGKQFIEVITRRIGVLYRQGEVCHWIHSSFREHLAAQALDRQLRFQQNNYSKVIGELLFNNVWYEVLLILCRVHGDQHSLLVWMAAEVNRRVSGEAALLAYECFQLSDASVRAKLEPQIVKTLASGFGDRQAHSFVYQRIQECFMEMGGSAVEPLIEVLIEYQGLQKRLLPNWTDENKHPEIYEAPGDVIHQGFLMRMKVIKVLGEIGDQRAVEPLISVITQRDTVDSFRFEITRQARRALRCIGLPAVEPLLKRICDASLPLAIRGECLTALSAVRLRTTRVSKALGATIREGLRDNIELFGHAIQVATILRDRGHSSYAIRALKHRDHGAVRDAARYLSEMPVNTAFVPVETALARWRLRRNEHFDVRWTVKHLVDALVATGGRKAERRVLSFFKKNLSEDEKSLTPSEVVQDVGDLLWPQVSRLLLRELTRRIGEPSQSSTLLLHDLLKWVAAAWRPQQIRSLVAATRELEAGSKRMAGFPSQLVDLLNNKLAHMAEPQAPRIYIKDTVVLKALAKCQVTTFTRQIGRLLNSADYSFEIELADALWVTEDTAAESTLIAKLRHEISARRRKARSEPEEYHVLRALSTCSTKRGAREVISYVRNNPDLSIYLPEDVLCPLVRRGVLSATTLKRMAEDRAGTHVYLRRQCVEAVGYLDRPGCSSFFVRVLQNEPDEQAQGYAASFLGWSKPSTSSSVQALCRTLSSTPSAFVADRAAQSLVGLKHTESLPLIEAAIERFGTRERASGLLRAAARFRSQSTLAMLMSGGLPEGRAPIARREILSAVGEFYDRSDWARDIVKAELENAHQGIDLGEQRDAVAVLASRDPNWLLERAARLYDDNRFDRSAALTLVGFMRRITKSRSLTQSSLVGILKRLVCDQDLDVREATGESLVFVSTWARQKLNRELKATNNQWAQACRIYSMAFWDSDVREIETARFDPLPVIRYMANVALTIRSKRPAINQVSRVFRTSSGVNRTSAFFSLAEQASESHVNALYRQVKDGEAARIFLRDLAAHVRHRVKDERQKRSKEEENRFCERVRGVRF